MSLRKILSNESHFYLMHLSFNGQQREDLWKYAQEHDVIGLDYPRIVDRNWNFFNKQLMLPKHKVWFKQFEMFCNEMPREDNALVIVVSGWDSILGIGRIHQAQYQYDKRLSDDGIFFDHYMKIKWLPKYSKNYADRIMLDQRLSGFNRTLIKVEPGTRFWEILSEVDLV